MKEQEAPTRGVDWIDRVMLINDHDGVVVVAEKDEHLVRVDRTESYLIRIT